MTMIDECHVCGEDAQLVREPMEIAIGRRSCVVEVERMRCVNCGTEFFIAGQMDAAQKAATARMREEGGLLSSEDIEAIRKAYRLTQGAFERLLGVGAKTVVRWERGTVFQNHATDALLRIIRDVPAAAEYLASIRGMDLESEGDVAAPSAAPVSHSNMHYRLEEVASALVGGPPPDTKVFFIEDYRNRRLRPVPPHLQQEARL